MVNIKKILLLRCIHHFKSDLMNNMDHMRISGAEPSSVILTQNIDVCKTLMPPFPNIWMIGSTFDPDLWPTDLSINRDHLLNKDYLPTKIEASGAKRSWVISCTRWSRLAWSLTLTFELMTWISIGVFYSSRTIYLPSLKLLGKEFLSY